MHSRLHKLGFCRLKDPVRIPKTRCSHYFQCHTKFPFHFFQLHILIFYLVGSHPGDLC